MTQVNEVEDPAALIAVPTEEDIDVIQRIMENAYDDLANDNGLTDPSTEVEREGTLCQEVLTQLHKQTGSEQ